MTDNTQHQPDSQLTIDKQFKALIRPLTADEFSRLEANILADGCRDALVVWRGENILLDGHNRYEICQQHHIPFQINYIDFTDRNAALLWIFNNQLARRNLTESQRAMLVQKYANIVNGHNQYQEKVGGSQEPPISNAAAAELANVSVSSVKRAKKVKTKGIPELAEAVNNDDIDLSNAAQIASMEPEEQRDAISLVQEGESAKKAITEVKRRKRIRERKADLADIVPEIIVGDMRILSENIADNSVDLIFTDPPYGTKHVPDYKALAIIAARILKPGGSLLCYSGQSVLPEVLTVMTPYICYHWICSISHSAAQRMPGKFVFIQWKPLLWFTKGPRRDRGYIADTTTSKDLDKTKHDWQQTVSEAAYYIEHLTIPGELVLDPFCGSGSTLVAAKQLGRVYTGFEIDEQTAAIAGKRLNETTR